MTTKTKQNFHILKCGYASDGDEKEEPPMPTHFERETHDQAKEKEKLQAIQEMANENDILLPAKFNREFAPDASAGEDDSNVLLPTQHNRKERK